LSAGGTSTLLNNALLSAHFRIADDTASDTSFEFECIVSTGLNTLRAMSLNSDPNRSRFFQEQAAGSRLLA
jgi:hypothetical protein